MQQLLEQQLLAEKAKAQTAGVLNVDLENLRNALILKEEALDVLEGENAALDDQLHAEMDEFEQVRSPSRTRSGTCGRASQRRRPSSRAWRKSSASSPRARTPRRLRWRRSWTA